MANTISIKPPVAWPTLGDNDYDVDGFVEDFEDICGIANSGRGVRKTAMIRALASSLKLSLIHISEPTRPY